MDFWSFMLKKEHLLLSWMSNFFSILEKIRYRKEFSKYAHFPIDNDEVYFVLNGPSLKDQDLTKLFGKNVAFVNRGFLHPLYSKIKPKFHFFVDNKILSGEWDLKWFDDIVKMNPNVVFCIPLCWIREKVIKEKVLGKYKILLLPNFIFSKFSCLGVSGAGLNFFIDKRFNKIFILGMEGTGLAYELVKSSNTHFYGENAENSHKTLENYKQDLYMLSRYFYELIEINKNKGRSKIINLTKGGIIDIFQRETF